MDKLNWAAAKDAAWAAYFEKEKENPVRLEEIEKKEMKYGEVTMRYGLSVIGEPGENGYPLYVAMHGGGFGETPDMNNRQWEHMAVYYKDSVKSGVYVNPRGVRDTWDTHGNPESFPLYDRLIENMILFYNVDPNKVYFLGFSAGGDGVYIISPRMADRMAATHMSAGHHNGTSIMNLHNTPIQLQVGIHDDAYGRNKVTVEYQEKLDGLEKQYGGYVHNTFVHLDKGHNFFDNHPTDPQRVLADNYTWLHTDALSERVTDTNAIRFLDQFTRNPLPNKIVWDLTNRAPLRTVESFYWVRADKETTEGLLVIHLDKENNAVVVEDESTVKKFSILLNDDMLDLDAPVKIVTKNGEKVVTVERSEDVLNQTTVERGDKNYQFAAVVEVVNE